MNNGRGFDANKILEDGVITGCTLRTLSDELNREEHEERVLNGVLSMVCTYPEGYKERQTIYSCLTCQQETGQVAGICYACSENCHDGHDVVQLYTKRLFCCDCGNSKFKGKCKLFEEKSAVNRKNRYGHNFKDKYCTCEKPYPPPEDDPMYGAEMFQCIMCEDWFHSAHIGAPQLTGESYGEMCCPECSVKFPFLSIYQYVFEQDAKDQEAERALKAIIAQIQAASNITINSEMDATSTSQLDQTGNTEERQSPPPVLVEDPNDCFFEKIKTIVPDEVTATRPLVFNNVDWRPLLCRCLKCTRMYEDLDCEFLLDDNDSLYAYLEKNASDVEKEKRDPQAELFDEIALRTNADVAHNAIAEIATLKRNLNEFFAQKAQDSKVVTADDIRSFFDGLTAKRRRLQNPTDEDNQ